MPAELITTGEPPAAALESLRNAVLATRYNGWRYIAVGSLPGVQNFDLSQNASSMMKCSAASMCGVTGKSCSVTTKALPAKFSQLYATRN